MNLDRRNFLRSLLYFLPLKADEKKQAIQRWKAKVGEKEAEKVKNTAATRGTAMHSYLEYHIAGQGLLDLTESGVEAKQMAQMIIDKGLVI
jgi:hypothetical protein